MPAVVLDTSVLIDVSRAEPLAVALLEELKDEGSALLIPTVVAAEYLAGSREPERDFLTLREAGEILDFTAEDARAAGALARQLFAEGRFPGWTDVFVAAAAEARGGLAVATANPRHFPRSLTRAYGPAEKPAGRRRTRAK